MAKKISNVEVRLYTLTAKNVIATSGPMNTSLGTSVQSDGATGSNGYNENMFVGGRDYYDDEY